VLDIHTRLPSSTKLVFSILLAATVGGITACGPSADAGGSVSGDAEGASSAASSQSRGDARARELIDGWIESVGGMQTFHDFQSARFQLSTELYDPESGRLQRARPRYVTLAKMNGEQLSRIERWNWSGSHYIVQAFDGDSARAWVDGERTGPGQMDADQALYVSRDVFYWFSLPYKLRDPGVNLHYDGTDDQARDVVRVTFGQGVGEHQDTWWYLFREGRSWPVEVRYQTEGSGGLNRLHWEGIRSVDGYFYPVERVHVNDRDQVWKILRETDVTMNPELSMANFRDPEASPWKAGATDAPTDGAGAR